MKAKVFKNFGEILDEVLGHLDLKQIDLTKTYDIDRGTISNDRKGPMTRRKMLKYRKFISEKDINEHFFLRGIYPILMEEVKEEAHARTANEDLRMRNHALEAIIVEKDKQIVMLREALHLCLSARQQGGQGNQ